MTNLFNKLNTVTFNTTIKVTLIPFVAKTLVFYEQTHFFSTEKINKVPDNKNSIKSKESLIKYSSILKDLTPEFKQWFVGFIDAEGCFMISIRYSNVITFRVRITLHIDELPLIVELQNKLGCGSIYKGKTKCELSISEKNALTFLILPILVEFPLNTTKYLNFLDFKEALNIKEKGNHLTTEGKLRILNLKANMNRARTDNSMPSDHTIRITPNWLIGFIEGDGSFYINKLAPMLRISQSNKDYKILEEIYKYFNSGTLGQNKITMRFQNEEPMVNLTFHNILFIHDKLLPLFNSLKFYTKKELDYKDWVIIVKLNYLGLHLNPRGKELINNLNLGMNNKRLSTFKGIKNKLVISQETISEVLSLEPLYKTIGLERINVITNNTVHSGRHYSIIVTSSNSSTLKFDSLKDCSKALGISNYFILKNLDTGQEFKGFIFKSD